jgi:hypothetical protein
LKFLTFRGAYPREADALHVDAEGVEQFAEKHPTAARVIVAGRVMAVARMTPGNDHRVRARLESFDNQVKVNATSAWKADNPNIRRVFKAIRARQIRAEIRAPVTDVCDYLRFKRLFAHWSLFIVFYYAPLLLLALIHFLCSCSLFVITRKPELTFCIHPKTGIVLSNVVMLLRHSRKHWTRHETQRLFRG